MNSDATFQNKILSLGELESKAIEIRKSIIEMLLAAGSGHSAGPLGMADIFTALYFHVLKHDPNNPSWPDRDRLILSNGHTCPIWYATLAHAGYFPVTELKTFRSLNSRLQGHPKLNSAPGIENTSGPLGQGLSQAIGLASAFKINQSRNRVFCIMSDGEHQEGQTWEAYMYAGARRLNNLTVLIDRNNIQIDGFTEDIMPLQPFATKIESMRWTVLKVDGHNIEAIIDACNQAEAIQEQPVAIVCNTIPGKGVEFMENDFEWHGKVPNQEQSVEALNDLRSMAGKIWWE
jgi:transketolase